jgi:hypothetical protein
MAGQASLQGVPQRRGYDSTHGYPEGALVFPLNNDVYEIHYIHYAGGPASLFDNAPNGSVCFDYTNSDVYIKNGTLGGIDGSWVKGSP